VTVGEGYHNFHHEFPNDYRNGVEWYQYDPTKWFIRATAFFGLAYDLLRFPQNEIDKGVLQMEQKALNGRKAKLFWGPDPDALPVITRDQVSSRGASSSEAGESTRARSWQPADVA
jgi:stearoyl-CoA desaturase (Delta-9 desaturase)